ncbi:MAG: hypothetical protein Q4D20_07610, partial [Clostridia bacterium]|nr:hypothetical protein [Clostridia bacterium]
MSERLFAAILSLPYLSDKLKEEITKTRFESKHGENYELLMFFNETAKDFEQSLVPKEIKEIEFPNEGLVLSDKITIIRLTYSLAKYSIESGEVLFSN